MLSVEVEVRTTSQPQAGRAAAGIHDQSNPAVHFNSRTIREKKAFVLLHMLLSTHLGLSPVAPLIY